MATYHYKNAALIERVEVTSPRVNITHATIIASKKADGTALEEVRKKLGRLGYSTLMDEVDGDAAIQVRGIKSESKLIKDLEVLDLAGDGAEKDLTKAPERKPSFSERVRGSALFLSAVFYDIGNIAFIVSGFARGKHNRDGRLTSNDWSEIGIGAAFGLGDVLMTIYGHERGDEELTVAAQGLKKHLHQKGIEVPRADTLNPDTLYQSGVMKAANRWLSKHIGQVKCLTEFVGGLFTIHAGRKIDQETKKRNHYKVAAGALITTGWASTFLLEKPRGENILGGNIINGQEPPPQTFWEKVKSNPRGWIAAPAAVGNNLFNLVGAAQERERGLYAIETLKGKLARHDIPANRKELAFAQRKQKDYYGNVVSACSFLVANALFGLSGTGNRPKETDDDKKVMHEMVLMSANVLAQQPEKIREASLSEAADYVSRLSHVDSSREEIELALREKVTALSHSNWASRVQSGKSQEHQITV